MTKAETTALRPLSLAQRLTLLIAVAAMLIFVVFGWVIGTAMEQHFEAGDIAELEVIGDAVEEGLAGVRSAADFAALEKRFKDILVSHHRAALYISEAHGAPVYASAGPDLSALARRLGEAPDGSIHRWSDADHNYRALVRRGATHTAVGTTPYTLTIALQTDYHIRFLTHFRKTLWLMIVASIGIMTFMGWVAVRQGHAPLRRIVTRIRRISASQLNVRLEPDTVPAELRDLAVSFNEMLQRVDASFHRLADFNADIAHELRTPIANLMTQTQVAMSRARTVEQYRETLYSNMEEYERMAQTVNDMLFLAQTESSPRQRDDTPLALAQEVQALFDYYEGWADERGVSLQLEGDGTIRGDRSMLRRALGNLLSNAIRHTPSGEIVRVLIASASETQISLVVENPGENIAAEHLPKLFDRFYRVDPSRQREGSGAGLGLAIVKSIVEAHGGKITVQSASGLTRFELRLPADPDGRTD